MSKQYISSIARTISFALLALALTGLSAPAFAQSGGSGGGSGGTGGGGSGAIAIVSIETTGAKHALQAVKVTVNRAGTEVEVEIRDPECPTKTSTITVNVASKEITGHSGKPCHDYTGWKVRGIAKIKRPPPPPPPPPGSGTSSTSEGGVVDDGWETNPGGDSGGSQGGGTGGAGGGSSPVPR